MSYSKDGLTYEHFLKIKIRKLQKANQKSKRINVALSTLSIILFGLLIVSNVKIGVLRSTIADLNSSIGKYSAIIGQKNVEISKLVAENSEIVDTMQRLSNTAISINNDLNDLKNEYNTNMEKLSEFEERAELYDKYDYALYYNGERTDITYQRIKNVEEYAKEEGLSDDAVGLVLALGTTESHGDAKAENKSSTAAGWGQLLYPTAKFVYEDYLKNGAGTYDYTMALDPDLNIKMTTSYVGYLTDYYDGDAKKVVTSYRGRSDSGYIKAVEEKLNKSGLSLYTISLIGCTN